MTPYGWILMIVGYVVVLGGLALLVPVFRRRSRKPPARHVHRRTPAPAPGVVLAAGRVDTTSDLPAVRPLGGGYWAGRVSDPLGLAGPQDARLDGIAQNAPRRVVAAPHGGVGAATLTLPAWATSHTVLAFGHGREPGRVYIGSKTWTRAVAATNDADPLEHTHR